jgi:hypothetical protein
MMKKVLALACLLVLLTPALPQTAGAQALSISVQPDKKTKGDKGSKMTTNMITFRLMKNKLPSWSVIEMKPGSKDNPMAIQPDISVEYKLAERKAGDAGSGQLIMLTISVRSLSLDKLLFAKMASSAPRDFKKPGEKNRAMSDTVDMAMPSVIEYLKGYTEDLAKNGNWYRVTIENAPAGLLEKVQNSLNGVCAKTEVAKANLSFFAQCKQAAFELGAVITKVFEAQAPKAEYDVRAQTTGKLTYKFKK